MKIKEINLFKTFNNIEIKNYGNKHKGKKQINKAK